MQSFDAVLERDQDAVSILCAGEMDLTASEDVRSRAAEAFGLKPGRVIVDLTGTTFIDSSGLNVMLGIHEMSRDSGIPVALRPGPASVMRVFSLVGLDGLFQTA